MKLIIKVYKEIQVYFQDEKNICNDYKYERYSKKIEESLKTNRSTTNLIIKIKFDIKLKNLLQRCMKKLFKRYQ